MREQHFLRLRAATIENGLTLGDLASGIGITRQALTQKLAGITQFTLNEMLAACNLLKADIDIFFDPKLHNLQFKEKNKAV